MDMALPVIALVALFVWLIGRDIPRQVEEADSRDKTEWYLDQAERINRREL